MEHAPYLLAPMEVFDVFVDLRWLMRRVNERTPSWSALATTTGLPTRAWWNDDLTLFFFEYPHGWFGIRRGGTRFRASETRGETTIFYGDDGEIVDMVLGGGPAVIAQLPPTLRDGPPPELDPRWN